MIALVVGGSGFLGRHLVARLLAAGAQVRVYSRHSQRGRDDICHDDADGAQRDVGFMRGDITDSARLRAAISGADCVFHFAWTTVPQTADENPQGDVQSNLTAGLGLLDACRDAGVRLVVFPSSGGTVYGSSEAAMLDETSPTEPICSYGITKLAMEKYLALYRHHHGLDYRILRISNAYGEGQPADRPQGLIGVSLQRVARGEPLTIWGDGSAVRDYIHAEDAAECCAQAALRALPSAAPRVFNVSSGQGHSVREVMAAIEAVTGRALRVTYAPARSCDLSRAVLSNRRAREVLNWSPQVPLDEGLQRAWQSVRGGDREAAMSG